MSLLEEKAHRIMANGDNPTVVVDPATIAAVIGVIIQVVRLYKECKKTPTEAKEAMTSPNWVQRWKLRRMLRNALPSGVDSGEVYKSVLDRGIETTEDEVVTLYEEVR